MKWQTGSALFICYTVARRCEGFRGLSVGCVTSCWVVRPSKIQRSRAALFCPVLRQCGSVAFPGCSSSSLRLRAQPRLCSTVWMRRIAFGATITVINISIYPLVCQEIRSISSTTYPLYLVSFLPLYIQVVLLVHNSLVVAFAFPRSNKLFCFLIIGSRLQNRYVKLTWFWIAMLL